MYLLVFLSLGPFPVSGSQSSTSHRYTSTAYGVWCAVMHVKILRRRRLRRIQAGLQPECVHSGESILDSPGREPPLTVFFTQPSDLRIRCVGADEKLYSVRDASSALRRRLRIRVVGHYYSVRRVVCRTLLHLKSPHPTSVALPRCLPAANWCAQWSMPTRIRASTTNNQLLPIRSDDCNLRYLLDALVFKTHRIVSCVILTFNR